MVVVEEEKVVKVEKGGEGGEGGESGDVLEHPITTTQIFFTHRLGEVEEMFG